MNKSLNFQDVILNKVRKENITIQLFLLSGFQIKGLVKGFDNYVVIIEADGKIQMVYKHAVSTIIPLKPLNNLIFNDLEMK